MSYITPTKREDGRSLSHAERGGGRHTKFWGSVLRIDSSD